MEGESGAVTNRVRRSLEGILAMVETNQINIDCLNSRESQLACFTGHELDSFQLLRFSVTGFFCYTESCHRPLRVPAPRRPRLR